MGCCQCSHNSNCFSKFRIVWITICIFLTAVLPAAFFFTFFGIFTAETYGHVTSQITAPCIVIACLFLIVGATITIFAFIKKLYALIIVLIYFAVMTTFYFSFLLIFAGVDGAVIDLIGITFNSKYYYGWQDHFETELNCCAYYTEKQEPPDRCKIKAENGILSCKSIITEKYNSNYKLIFIILSAILLAISIATMIIIIISLCTAKTHQIFAEEKEDGTIDRSEFSSACFSNHWEEPSSGAKTCKDNQCSTEDEDDHIVHIQINNTTIPYDVNTFMTPIGNVYMNSDSHNAIVINQTPKSSSNSNYIQSSQFQAGQQPD